MNGGRMADAQSLDDAEHLRSHVLGESELSMDDETDGGTIKISENVIAAVVRKYCMEIDGVVRFASGSIVGGIAGMIAKRNYESSMVIDLADDAVSISVTLVFRFGVHIPDVAQAVQEVIRTRVEALTGKRVHRVNVLVHDLEDPVPVRRGEESSTR